VTRFPGPAPGACWAGPHSPRPPPLAPPAPQRIAPPCSSVFSATHGGVRRLAFVRHRRRLLAFPMRTGGLKPPARRETSRFPSKQPLAHARVFDHAGPSRRSRWLSPSISPSAKPWASAPGSFCLSRLHGWPAPSPADASPLAFRPATHGSGPMQVATPSSRRTSTDVSLPVSPRTGNPTAGSARQGSSARAPPRASGHRTRRP